MMTPNTATHAGSSSQKASFPCLSNPRLRFTGTGEPRSFSALATVMVRLSQRVRLLDGVVHGFLRRHLAEERLLDVHLQDLRYLVVVRNLRARQHRVVG